MPNRLPIDEYWISHLQLVASRATCLRRKTGAIITDARGAILSTGYNGVPSKVPHCGEPDSPCSGEGAGLPPGTGPRGDSGNQTTNCWAVHAEQNAILQCHRLDLARTIYCTNFPCFTCAKLIANTPICRVIAMEEYKGDLRGLELFRLPSRQFYVRIGNHVIRGMR